MPHIITVHSYRGGTGKSSTVANLALLLAASGRRVAVVDTDIQTPTLDVVFDLGEPPLRRSLTDYLIGSCEIEEAAYPARTYLGNDGLFLVPARSRTAGIGEIMGRGYDVGLLREGFDRLLDSLDLDLLLLDTHAGFNNETVTAMASSDVLLIMTRADRLDLASARETTSLTDRLGCIRRDIVVNMAPDGADHDELRAKAEAAYGSAITAVLPYAPEMAALAGERLITTAYPHHRLVAGYREVLASITEGTVVARR